MAIYLCLVNIHNRDSHFILFSDPVEQAQTSEHEGEHQAVKGTRSRSSTYVSLYLCGQFSNQFQGYVKW